MQLLEKLAKKIAIVFIVIVIISIFYSSTIRFNIVTASPGSDKSNATRIDNVTKFLLRLTFDKNFFERKREIIPGWYSVGIDDLIPINGNIEKINNSSNSSSISSKPIIIEAFQDDKLFFRDIELSNNAGSFISSMFTPQDGNVRVVARIMGDNSTEQTRTVSVGESPVIIFYVTIFLCIAISLLILIIYLKPAHRIKANKNASKSSSSIKIISALVMIASAILIILAAVLLYRFQPLSVGENSGIIAVLLTPILGIIINYVQAK